MTPASVLPLHSSTPWVSSQENFCENQVNDMDGAPLRPQYSRRLVLFFVAQLVMVLGLFITWHVHQASASISWSRFGVNGVREVYLKTTKMVLEDEKK